MAIRDHDGGGQQKPRLIVLQLRYRSAIALLTVAAIILLSDFWTYNLVLLVYGLGQRHLFAPSSSSAASPPRPPHAPYWDLSCPLEDRAFSVEGRDRSGDYSLRRASDAASLSAQSGALAAITDAVLSGALSGRRVVFLGDSLMRQTYVSFGCLSHAGGLWGGNDEDVARGGAAAVLSWYDGVPQRRLSDARIRFRDGLGEIMSSPAAGSVQGYHWREGRGALVGEEDWLRACKERGPFVLETYRLPPSKEGKGGGGVPPRTRSDPIDMMATVPSNEASNLLLEKVTLTGDDVVVFNSGYHFTRGANRRRLSDLLECMKDARRGGEAWTEWPSMRFLVTSQQHFPTESGVYSSNQTKVSDDSADDDGCSFRGPNPFQEEDVELFGGGRLPLIGTDLDMSSWAGYHVGGKDCYHWFQPGVPDLFAAEVAKAVVADPLHYGEEVGVNAAERASLLQGQNK